MKGCVQQQTEATTKLGGLGPSYAFTTEILHNTLLSRHLSRLLSAYLHSDGALLVGLCCAP